MLERSGRPAKGLLTDFFVADRGSLDPANIEGGPEGTYPTAQWKNVDTIKLATLENLLTGVDYEIAVDRLMKNTRGDFGDEGPWIHEISENLVTALARVDSKRTREVAAAWIATEEWEADGAVAGEIESFEEMLTSFSFLARKAVAGRLGMYVWISL